MIIALLIIIFITAICWGSFLNVIAYRLTFDKPFFTMRSRCPHCNTIIAWYDNIPIFSWLILRGKCRQCNAKISMLYPFIELLTGIVGIALWIKLFPYGFNMFALPSFLAYAIFFSALIVSVRTDLETLVIPQLVTIWLAPVGVIASSFHILDITMYESIMGASIGYAGLWLVAKLFTALTKKDGLGIGDMELFLLIGAFLGPLGVWTSVLIGSISGLVIGGGWLLITKQSASTKIPFGPFLALGATLFFFFKSQIIYYFFS